ncbi:MAG: 50S ribosomal protein L19 [Deltaproteobacteria bacterium]|nr:50S ribosomal protein L19 [Deltaproteobacteria bacterium]|tara:strand:+ start:330 stop:710 length:381 start_codon:yes stop_codon:yes gene_type:complete
MSSISIIENLDSLETRQDIPEFRAGDTLRVHVRIREGEKERVQVFEGTCISRHNNGVRSTFTVRKLSYGVGVERVFPLHSPRLATIEVKDRGRVRRSRLYYLRERIGKAARVRNLRDVHGGGRSRS